MDKRKLGFAVALVVFALDHLTKWVVTGPLHLNRLGDQDKADAVYAGVREPLVADDIADCIAWTATRPQHVNVDRLVVRPIAQAAQHKVVREK